MDHVNGDGPTATTPFVEFTQYLLPNGRKMPIRFPTTPEVAAKAKTITDAGYKFEIEMLSTGVVSATIMDPIADCDAAIILSNNDPTVSTKITKLIMDFEPLPKEQRSTFVE